MANYKRLAQGIGSLAKGAYQGMAKGVEKATPVVRSAAQKASDEVGQLRQRMMSKVEAPPEQVTEEMINVLSPEQLTQRVDDLKSELMEITRRKAEFQAAYKQQGATDEMIQEAKLIRQFDQRKEFLMQQLDELAGAPQTIEDVSAARLQTIDEDMLKHRMNNPRDIREITPEQWNRKPVDPDDAEFLQESYNEYIDDADGLPDYYLDEPNK